MENAIDEKQIRQNVLSMIIPVTIEGILQMVSSTVIMAMLGRIDPLAVNAVGIGTRMTQLLWSFVRGMGVGITVCVARAVGAQKTENVKLISLVGTGSLVVLVGFFSALLAIFAPEIVGFFGATETMLDSSIKYMQIICIGLPFWSVMLSTAGVLQGFGDARTPMIVSVVYNVVNIAAGWVLMFGKFGFPQMGIVGAAISVVFAQIVMCFICLYILYRKGILRNVITELTENISNTWAQLKHLYSVGVPSAFENMVWQLGSIAMLKPVISFGEVPYATHQLAMQAESISFMPTMGFGIAATSLVGRSFGANDMASAKMYFKKIFKYMAIVSGCTMFILLFLPKMLMGILTPSPEIINLGAIYLVITGCTLIPQNLHGVYCGALRGAGHTKPPMYFAMICLWGIRVPLTYIFAYLVKDTTIVWVWFAMSTDILTRFILSSTYFRRAKIFKTRQIAEE